MPTIALFADVQNIYYTTRQAYSRQFNYRALWAQVSAMGSITHARAYAIDRNDSKQAQFQSTLRQIGFDVRLKPFIQRSDGSSKGDWDVGITIDVMDLAQQVDIVVLVSGDGDFAILMDKIRYSYGVRGEVYGVSPLTADALVHSCDAFHPIEGELLL